MINYDNGDCAVVGKVAVPAHAYAKNSFNQIKEKEQQEIIASGNADLAVELLRDYDDADVVALSEVVVEHGTSWDAAEFTSLMTAEECRKVDVTKLQQRVVEEGNNYCIQHFVIYSADHYEIDIIALTSAMIDNPSNCSDEELSEMLKELQSYFPNELTNEVMRELESGVVL